MSVHQRLDEISQKIIDKLTPELRQGKAGIEHNLQQAVVKIIDKLDLVSREKIDSQNKVLARLETQIEQLEQRLAQLENTQHNECASD